MTNRFTSRLAAVAALAGVYVAAARLGLSLAFLHPSATPVWPPTGIALAALLLYGYRLWPGVFVGALAANLWISGALAPSLGIAVGNTLEAVVGAWLVCRFAGGRRAFERPGDVFRFAGLAAMGATLISATVGPVSLCLGGLARWAEFGPIWLTWWLGDASGALLVAPVLLTWTTGRAAAREGREKLESVLLLGGVVAVGLVVFGGLIPTPTTDLPLEFLCLPFLVAIAFRLGIREAALANLLLASVAIACTLRARGPFHRPDFNESLVLLQAFSGVVALTTAALAAVVSERRRVTQFAAVLESAVDSAAEGVVILAGGAAASRPRITFANGGFLRMTGLARAEVLGQPLDLLSVSPAETMAEARRVFATGGGLQREVVVRRPDGSDLAVELQIIPVHGGHGDQSPSWVGVLRDVSERRRHLAALEHQALHDALSGLPNRLLLRDRLEQTIRGARREAGSLAVLLIDLDRFKEINDTFGHPVGDALLTQIGPRIQGVLRSVDTVARFGGDEFVILLPASGGRGDAGRTAEKILETLESVFVVGEHTLEISASIGIALFPEHGTDGAMLMRAADVAMYAAKRSSNGYAVYSEADDAYTRSRLVLLEELRHGLQAGEFFLAYQPEVELETGRLARVEALVRWRHPARGIVFPDEFISGAERIGLIREMTDWVLETALRQCAEWRAAGLEVPIAVNASIRILRDAGLAERVRRVLDRLGLEPGLLTLEITESVTAEPLHALSTLAALRETGVRLAIDDFGVGALSLRTLKQLPVDEIKIDRSFVTGMDSHETNAAVVRSIVDLAHLLGCRAVAEGVESEAVRSRLSALGCDLIQGTLVSPPLEAAEVARFVAERRLLTRG